MENAPEEKKASARVASKVGRSLWQIDNKAALKGVTAEERKEKWKADRKTYVGKGRELVKRLTKGGVSFTVSENVKDDADNDAPGDDD